MKDTFFIHIVGNDEQLRVAARFLMDNRIGFRYSGKQKRISLFQRSASTISIVERQMAIYHIRVKRAYYDNN